MEIMYSIELGDGNIELGLNEIESEVHIKVLGASNVEE